MLTWPATTPRSLDDQYVQYTVQNAVYNLDYGNPKSWQGSLKVLDSVVRTLEFKFLALLLTIKPVSLIFALKQTSCLPFNS